MPDFLSKVLFSGCVIASIGTYSHLAAASTSSGTTAPPPLTEVIRQAINICTSSFTNSTTNIPENGTIYSNLNLSSLKHITEAPEFIRLYADRLDWVNFTKPNLYIALSAEQGQVWIIPAPKLPACDFAVTGSEDPRAAESVLQSFPQADGWELIATRSAPTGTNGTFSQHLLFKALPKPDAPEYGMRARVEQWPFTADTKDGIQLNASLVAGKVEIRRRQQEHQTGSDQP